MTKQEIGGKENKEFYEDARKVAESCSKERLVELYLAEVQTCCEVEEYKEIADNTIEMYAEKCKVLEKALKLSREYMFNVMCADDVPSVEWFIKCAKEAIKSEQ